VALHAYRLKCFILQSANGFVIAKNLPPHVEAGFESIKTAIKVDTEAKPRHLALAKAIDLAALFAMHFIK
jgi:hypothetical protein